jgi:hypothetical protein
LKDVYFNNFTVKKRGKEGEDGQLKKTRNKYEAKDGQI